jgi:hypothetical protein
VLLAANAIPTPAKDTASIELTGETQRATTVKPEALEPWVEGVAWRAPDTTPREGSIEGALVPLTMMGWCILDFGEWS